MYIYMCNCQILSGYDVSKLSDLGLNITKPKNNSKKLGAGKVHVDQDERCVEDRSLHPETQRWFGSLFLVSGPSVLKGQGISPKS